MRRGFIKAITELAEKDKNVYLLTGDLGFRVFEDFSKKFPKQYINCGVAEQNMMGLAAGLALSGKKPYVYSIVPFATLRCLEQIRDDICYQNLNVKIVGVGGGFSYGSLGYTHIVMEDLAILRTLPNMTVVFPGDISETQKLVAEAYKTKSPTYIRLANAGNFKIHERLPDIKIGKQEILKKGRKGLIIANGVQSAICLKALKELKMDLKLINMHTLKPIDEKILLKEVSGYKKIMTIEEHSIIGGLNSAVSEILARNGWQGVLKPLAMPDLFPSKIGKADYLRNQYGLDKEGIAKNILKFFK